MENTFSCDKTPTFAIFQGTSKWYELQDLHVADILPQMITLSESYIQVSSEEEIRCIFDDNFKMICVKSSFKSILWVLIRICSSVFKVTITSCNTINNLNVWTTKMLLSILKILNI